MSSKQRTKITFDEIVKKTAEVSDQFPQKYDLRDHFIDLVEEVGELAQALQISEGRKKTNDPRKQRSRDDVVDAMCDVMFELIRIAEMQKIDLGEEYMKTMDHIQSRIDNGEFTLPKE